MFVVIGGCGCLLLPLDFTSFFTLLFADFRYDSTIAAIAAIAAFTLATSVVAFVAALPLVAGIVRLFTKS